MVEWFITTEYDSLKEGLAAESIVDDFRTTAAGMDVGRTMFGFDEVGEPKRAERSEERMAYRKSVVEVADKNDAVALFVDGIQE